MNPLSGIEIQLIFDDLTLPLLFEISHSPTLYTRWSHHHRASVIAVVARERLLNLFKNKKKIG